MALGCIRMSKAGSPYGLRLWLGFGITEAGGCACEVLYWRTLG